MVEAFGHLREHDVQVLTVGQYLRPTERHLPVVRYWHPDEFKALEDAAYALGFDHIAAGPLVRSSYHADEHVAQERGHRPAAAAAPARQRPAFTRRARCAARRCCHSGDAAALARRPRVPAQGQHPDAALPGRHGGADRAQRARVPSSGRRRARRSDSPTASTTSATSTTSGRDPVRDHAPGRPDRRRRAARRRPPPTWLTVFTAMFMHGEPAAPRRQHALPVDLRQQRRGLDGPGEVRRLLPARRARGAAGQVLDRPGLARCPNIGASGAIAGVLGGYLRAVPARPRDHA